MTATDSQYRIHLARSTEKAEITIGDGTRHNALRTDDWHRLAELACSLHEGDDLRYVVIRGAGRSFCSGSDLREWMLPERNVDDSFVAMEAAFVAIQAIPTVTIAVIEGNAMGAGCQLAAACDLRLVAASARIGMPVLRLGIQPGPSFFTRLSCVIGVSRAADLLFTGRAMDALDAQSCGFATSIGPDDQIDSMLTQLLATITSQPLGALRATKYASRVSSGDVALPQSAWSWTEPEEFTGRISQFVAQR